MLWTGKWPLVIFSLILSVLIVPIVSVLFYPETPLATSILGGVVLSLFVAIGLRVIQGAKTLGLRFVIAVMILAVFIGLLMGIFSKLLL